MSRRAKHNAITYNYDVQYELDDLQSIDFAEDYVSLKRLLNSVGFSFDKTNRNLKTLTVGSKDGLDIDFTLMGEEIFTMNGLDDEFHILVPDVESDGTEVGDAFASAWYDAFYGFEDNIYGFDSKMDDFLRSIPNAEDIIYRQDAKVKEYKELEDLLYSLPYGYKKCAEEACRAAADVFVEHYDSWYDEDNPSLNLYLDDFDFRFDKDGNILNQSL